MLIRLDPIDLDLLTRHAKASGSGTALTLGIICAVLLVVGLIAIPVSFAARGVTPAVEVSEEDRRATWQGYGVLAAALAFLAVLIVGCFFWHASDSKIDRRNQLMEQARAAETVRALEEIEASLMERYRIEAVALCRNPVATAMVDEDDTDWLRDQVVTAFQNDLLDASVPSAVVLEDGAIVAWAVIADPATGEARFITHLDSEAPGPRPAEIERTSTSD